MPLKQYTVKLLLEINSFANLYLEIPLQKRKTIKYSFSKNAI